ncbi:hypothetical protein FACS1894188_07560 [Clostridia bacterium]|nr:hypothetical protein FACS1894188_07560 [Clostridia bacterium]
MGKYKYDPEDFRDVGLSEDLSRFYELLEIYHNSQSNHDRWAFRAHWENLFFAVKANVVTGRINPVTARDFQDYLEELTNG